MVAARKLSDLPAIPPTAGALRPILEAMREVIVTGEGNRGDALDRKITVRDLLGTGLVDIRRGARPGVGSLVPTNPAPDMSIPPGPGGFQAVSVFGFITLIWDSPNKHYRNHGLTNIYRSAEDNIGNAVLVGRTAGFSYNDPMRGDLAGSDGFYYWIRWVSAAGVEGPPNSPDGTYVEPMPDIEWLQDKIGGEIDESWLNQELSQRIDLVDGSGDGSVNQRINAARLSLEEQISQLIDPLVYDPAVAYARNETVRVGRRLYQAKDAVPAGNPPPDPDFWLDAGETIEAANGVATQVQKNTTDIANIDGVMTAQASRIDVLRAALRDEDDGTTALEGALRGWQVSAQFAQEVSTRVSEHEATTRRLTTLDSSLAGNRASITALEETVATDRLAMAQTTQQLRASLNDHTAALQQQATVLNGVAASWVLKTDVNGHIAGYGLYNDGATADFSIIADRFWIARPGSSSKAKPFMVVDNIVYLDTAMIRDASIQSGKLGPISFGKLVDAGGNPITTVAGKLMAQHIAVDQIEIGFAQVAGDIFSTNYVSGQMGWILRRNGEFEINGSAPGGGRLKITPMLIQMWYPNGNLLMRMGRWA